MTQLPYQPCNGYDAAVSYLSAIVQLNKQITIISDMLKSTDSEYGKYLRLKERYKGL